MSELLGGYGGWVPDKSQERSGRDEDDEDERDDVVDLLESLDRVDGAALGVIDGARDLRTDDNASNDHDEDKGPEEELDAEDPVFALLLRRLIRRVGRVEEDERVRHRAPGVDERVNEEDETQGEEDEVADCCREAGQRTSRDMEE